MIIDALNNGASIHGMYHTVVDLNLLKEGTISIYLDSWHVQTVVDLNLLKEGTISILQPNCLIVYVDFGRIFLLLFIILNCIFPTFVLILWKSKVNPNCIGKIIKLKLYNCQFQIIIPLEKKQVDKTTKGFLCKLC